VQVFVDGDKIIKIDKGKETAAVAMKNEAHIYDLIAENPHNNLMHATEIGLWAANGKLAGIRMPRAPQTLLQWVASLRAERPEAYHQGQLRASVVSGLALQLLLGIQHMHEQLGYAHLDVKPPNVVVMDEVVTASSLLSASKLASATCKLPQH
jgi:serine/threonine protein kinase